MELQKDLKPPGAGLLRAQNSLILAIPLKTEIKKVENKFNHQSIIQDKFNSVWTWFRERCVSESIIWIVLKLNDTRLPLRMFFRKPFFSLNWM